MNIMLEHLRNNYGWYIFGFVIVMIIRLIYLDIKHAPLIDDEKFKEIK